MSNHGPKTDDNINNEPSQAAMYRALNSNAPVYISSLSMKLPTPVPKKPKKLSVD